MLPITSLVAELFNEDVSSDVSITVDGPGTGDGFVLFCDGETDISDASRPIELEGGSAGLREERHRVRRARGRVRRHHRHDQPGQRRRHVPEQGRPVLPVRPGVRRHRHVGRRRLPRPAGGWHRQLPERAAGDHRAREESGTYDAFIELAGIEDTALSQGVPEDKAASLRTDYHSSPDDNVIITAMEGSDTPLGFVGFAYAENAGDQVKILQVDGGDGCVEPTRDTIADALLPAVPHAVHLREQGQDLGEPRLKAFVDYYLSDAGIVDAVQQTGYVDLPSDQIESSRSTWTSASGGPERPAARSRSRRDGTGRRRARSRPRPSHEKVGSTEP